MGSLQHLIENRRVMERGAGASDSAAKCHGCRASWEGLRPGLLTHLRTVDMPPISGLQVNGRISTRYFADGSLVGDLVIGPGSLSIRLVGAARYEMVMVCGTGRQLTLTWANGLTILRIFRKRILPIMTKEEHRCLGTGQVAQPLQTQWCAVSAGASAIRDGAISLPRLEVKACRQRRAQRGAAAKDHRHPQGASHDGH